MKKGFRDQFKYYKKKDVPPDLQKVVNFNTIKDTQCFYQNHVKQLSHSNLNTDVGKIYGLTDSSHWEIYELLNKPGLIFIKNPFSTNGQRYWVIRCLEYYTKKPSKLNIDAHDILKSDKDWWEFCQSSNNTLEGKTALGKLRWATFGYHHNWNTKEYSESSKCPFPLDLNALCGYIAEVLNFSNFNAEAAIINMYHFGSSLSGHTDHSEVNVGAPLFSFSLGQSAIFLIGGKSIDDETTPILLESGDIIIMSGESRLCYHGVPRILPSEKRPWDGTPEEVTNESHSNSNFLEEIIDKLWNNKIWEPFESYVSKSRINMNVRQVLLPGQKTLDS